MAKTPRLYNIKAEISDELISNIISGVGGIASETLPGVVSTANQTFSGVKTFKDGIILPSSFSLRNKLINGDMRISQRYGANKRTSVAANGYEYNVDRWSVYSQTANTISTQQTLLTAADEPLRQDGLSYYLRANKETTASTTDVFILQQAIEGLNAADLKWGTAYAKNVTISFWARASASVNYSLSICNTTTSATMIYVIPFNVTTSWQKFTFTIPGATSGTWASDNTCGISVRFVLGGGGTTNNFSQWKADNLYVGGSTQFGTLAQNSYFDLTGVQFEVGSVATPFEHRPYGMELQLSQRYWETIRTTSGIATGFNASGLRMYMALPWKATKRAGPVVTQTNLDPGGGTLERVSANADVVTMRYLFTYAGGDNGSPNIAFFADAEL